MGRLLGKAALQQQLRASEDILEVENEETGEVVIEEIKTPISGLECSVCGFIAKNENGLRLHSKKHKE